jgi:hypothetical protein
MRSTARWNRLTVDQSRSSRVGFEAGVAQSRDQGVEDVGDSTRDSVAFGKRSRVRLVVEGTIAVELKLAQDVIGRG